MNTTTSGGSCITMVMFSPNGNDFNDSIAVLITSHSIPIWRCFASGTGIAPFVLLIPSCVYVIWCLLGGSTQLYIAAILVPCLVYICVTLKHL
uniref:Uncharacterized protein n=1 Tax=Babesia bovis TaxID=5865 RepID=S6BFQ9_BABBO|nr:hypothetical protein [Babesia bovis]